MYVLATSLEADDFAVLDETCAELGLTLHDADPEGTDPDWSDVVLAALHTFGTAGAGPSPAQIKSRGGYPIAVLPSVSATDVLAALAGGFSFVLASPLRRPRLLDCLGYLKSVVPPLPAQVLTLDRAGNLASPSKSVPVSAAEAAMLRCLAARPGQIVGATDLVEAVGDADLNVTASVLKQKLNGIDSGAKVLKLPHLGFRLMGTVQDADPPSTAEHSEGGGRAV